MNASVNFRRVVVPDSVNQPQSQQVPEEQPSPNVLLEIVRI